MKVRTGFIYVDTCFESMKTIGMSIFHLCFSCTRILTFVDPDIERTSN